MLKITVNPMKRMVCDKPTAGEMASVKSTSRKLRHPLPEIGLAELYTDDLKGHSKG